MNPFLVPKLDLKAQQFTISVPSSKSIANRALILAALRKGTTTLKGDFAAEDIQIMIKALQKLGVKIVNTAIGLKVVNDMSWRSSRKPLKLDIGNSGTSIRFLASLVCLRKGNTTLIGKPRMMQRPIADLVDALKQAGANIEYLKDHGFPPLKVIGQGTLPGGTVKVKADVSSQFLSSLMLISPACDQKLLLKTSGKVISKPYIAMTKAIMSQFKVSRVFRVEGDASAAVYWWALGFLHDAKVTVSNVPKNSRQGDARFASLFRTLRLHKGTQEKVIDMNDMPDASLMLMATAPYLKFPLKIVNIASLRVKETDRIAAMAAELSKVGVKVKTGKDWIMIWPGFKHSSSLKKIETYDDHRIAMSMAILGTRLGNLQILDPDCVNKTYPEFWNDLKKTEKL